MQQFSKRILAILPILMAGGCGSAPDLPADNGQAIAENFLAAIRSGKADEAWLTTTSEFKSLMGRESFREYVRKRPALKQTPKFQSAKAVENNDLKLVECQFATEGPNAGSIRVLLSPSASAWQVERLIVD